MTSLETKIREYYTPNEIQEALRVLTPNELMRIKKIAWQYVGGHMLDADDLVSESLYRAISGVRETWPKDISLVTFVAGIIESIAGDERRKYKEEKKKVRYIDADGFKDPGSNKDNPETCLIDIDSSEKLAKTIDEVFADDDEALLMIMHREAGDKAGEIMKVEKWDKTAYETIRKRIKRQTEKFFPKKESV